MKPRAKKRSLARAWRILAVIAIHVLTVSWAAWYMYRLQAKGRLLGVQHASRDIPGIVGQNLMETLVPALLFVLFACLLKKKFVDAMALRLRETWQRIIAAALGIALMGITVYCLAVKQDKTTILYNLFYYLFVIAFAEEFLTRGVCVYLLRDEDWPLRYLVPNVCFALIHLFSHAGFGTITPAYLLQFLFTEVLGLTVIGCLMQFLKERSGTLWLPVLLHALMDYSAVLRY